MKAKLKKMTKDELLSLVCELYKQTYLSEKDVEVAAAGVILRKTEKLQREIKNEEDGKAVIKKIDSLLKLYDKADNFLKISPALETRRALKKLVKEAQ
ncbi:MAG: hypothetical protein GY749_08045 [Desulfobacteraceae bacterium]|nr:hypothetical protein [Desulfobacteraceae bacterium]